MTEDRPVPPAACEIAAQLADAFDADQQLATDQNAALERIRTANARLWSGIHPDALGLIYDDTAAAGIYSGGSVIGGQIVDALHAELPAAEVEAAVLPTLQEIHWTIHRAVVDYQHVSEDRRHLAADIGELTAAGWSEEQARNADVHQLAAGATAAAR